MPLLQATLKTAILRRTDPTRSDFAGWPAGIAGVADSWADVATAYFSGMTTPLPTAEALGLGYVAMRDAIVAAADSNGRLPQTRAQFNVWFPTAWAAFAAAMLPLLPLPPVAPPIGLFQLTAADFQATSNPGPPADRLATLIDTWTRTATCHVGGVPVPWS